MINTAFQLVYDDEMASSATPTLNASQPSNTLAELIQLTVNFSSFWAPAALLNSQISNSIVHSTDSSDNADHQPQLECTSISCSNLFNSTENANSKSSSLNTSIQINETVHFLYQNVTGNIFFSFPLNDTTDGFPNISTLLSQNESSKIKTLIVEPDLRLHHPILAIVLAIICVVVVFGNTLTMLSVWKERYLHTVTNYFVASLAAADCLVGAIVMPFSVVHEVMNRWWVFGQDWCDLWRSFDVLASTASILHLCVISLDRWMAITDPITYPSRMTPNKAAIFIAGIWFCSSLISFPAIVWWRAVREAPPPPYQCLFTDDVGYLVFSSIISFYGPLMVMVFTYYRIYVVASRQTRSLKLGVKQVQAASDGENSALTLRMHRGGNATAHHPLTRPKLSGDSSDDHDYIGTDENGLDKHASIRSRNMKANWSVGKRLAKLAKERKAAKTLGIVMGVFILCWLPFFVTNILMGICAESCLVEPDLVFSIVTWLGWLNSAMNPAIYACWSRDFRRAFRKILCSCCSSKNRSSNKGLHARYSYCGKNKTPKVIARKSRDEFVMSNLTENTTVNLSQCDCK